MVLVYYLTTRLGLRTGEVYAIGHRQSDASRGSSSWIGRCSAGQDPGSPTRSAQERRGDVLDSRRSPGRRRGATACTSAARRARHVNVASTDTQNGVPRNALPREARPARGSSRGRRSSHSSRY